MTGYTRAFNKTTGEIIIANDFNTEYQSIDDAFDSSTGHKHDGTAGEAAYVPLISDPANNNAVEIDESNNEIDVFVEVGGVKTQQIKVTDGAILPFVNNDIDLGSPTFKLKDAHFDGTVYVDGIDITSGTATSLVADSIQLTGGTGSQGTLTWNAQEDTLNLDQNGSVLQIGQEVHWHVSNNSGVTINDGEAVMATGTLGASGKITVAKMVGSSAANAKYLLGIATETIPNGSTGKITHFGKVNDINTSAWSDGQVLYVSTSVVGGLTATKPTSGLAQPVAFVVYSHATNGILAVRVDSLDENAFAALADNETVSGTWTFSSDPLISYDNTTSGLTATDVHSAIDEIDGNLDTHITDTTTHGTTGDIVGTSDSQTLTNKTIVAASNTITTAATGNLTSIDLNSALAELQTDIDTRELQGVAVAMAIALS